MSEFLAALVAIFVLSTVCCVMYILFFKKKDDKSSKSFNPVPSDRDRTVIKRRAIFQFKVHSTGKVYTIENIPENGLLVGVADDREEFLPANLRSNKLTVTSAYNHLSRKSFTVGKDADGMFINPHPECSNGVAVTPDGDPVKKSIPLEDNLSIYIGDEIITFYKSSGKIEDKNEHRTKIARIV